MRWITMSSVLAAAAMAMISGTPLVAAPTASSFYDIEHVVGEDGREDAERALVERIAGRGVFIEQARSALETAGASFVGSDRSGSLEFVYVLPETSVTVTLQISGRTISSTKVRRSTLGG
ncbi:hypothetical protein [Sphingomonas sp. BK069]|uniref:hypothetical protein n=1 Tax=Sphingomonas sp. BK069 TaxID=2586979 RepID=UPI00160F7B8F|nr:hypothetical protein [Sphingomonas sp. BK069]MBB3348364.1 hypothetical protein [Sphingomonas sp. BK069]